MTGPEFAVEQPGRTHVVDLAGLDSVLAPGGHGASVAAAGPTVRA